MKKKYTNIESKGLPGGPNEMFTYITGVFSTEGYRKDSPDVNNPYNIIDSSDISMKNVEFPILGIDNLGHTQMMYPGGEYKFQGDKVFEIPMFQGGGGWLARYLRDIQPQYEYTFARPGVADPTMGPNFLARSFIGNTTNPRKGYLGMDADIGYATNANLDSYYGNFPLFGGLGLNYIGPRIGTSPVRASLDLQARYSPFKGAMGQFRAAPRIGFKSKKLPRPFNYLQGYVDPIGASYGIASRPHQYGIEDTTPENVNPYNITSLESDPYGANWGFYSGLNAELGIGNKRSPFSIFGGLNLNYDPVKGKADEPYTEEFMDLATQSQGKLSTAITPEFRIGVRLDPQQGRSLKDKALLKIEEKRREELEADKLRREQEYIQSLSNASDEVEEVIDKPESRLEKLRRRRREKQEAKREAEAEMVRHPRFLKDGGPTDPPPHKVVTGDTFGAIAEKYNIPLSKLKEANPLTETWKSYDNLSLGQMIIIPELKVESAVTEVAALPGKKAAEAAAGVVAEEKSDDDFTYDLDALKKGIALVESADGKLMMNPSSSATGLYGQLFNEKGMSDIYSGTREEFAKDIDAQNRVFEVRLNKGIGGNSLIQDAKDVISEYKPQLDDFSTNYSNEDVIALVNFLGRQGTRKYFGNVIRDEMSLEKVYPHLYGEDVKSPNKTPQEYLDQFHSIKKEGGPIDKYTVYKNYVDGMYDNTNDIAPAEAIYDKLNRVHYRDAKNSGMSVTNYIMTNLIRGRE